MVNNWAAATELQKWKELYLDPIKAKVDEALGILGDENYKWKKGEKDRAKAKYKRIEFDYINYTTLYHAVLKLIEQHENQTDMLTELYGEWYQKIATDGAQPMEIMIAQYDIIQTMWARVYAAIHSLDLDIEPPKQIEKL